MKKVLPPLLCMLLASCGQSEGDELEVTRNHSGLGAVSLHFLHIIYTYR